MKTWIITAAVVGALATGGFATWSTYSNTDCPITPECPAEACPITGEPLGSSDACPIEAAAQTESESCCPADS
ncbi:MAG: hypothetical protein ACYTGQ_15215 [Planctomycetota bacterium]|jgi:hypothetical protein